MPFTIRYLGSSILFETPPAGTSPADTKEMIVGAFDLAVDTGTFSLRSLDGRAHSVFHAALQGSWELVLLPGTSMSAE
jgi:hypothetical protein